MAVLPVVGGSPPPSARGGAAWAASVAALIRRQIGSETEIAETMQNASRFSIWVSLISKLIWPVFIVVLLVIYSKYLGEAYDVMLESVKSGRSMEIGIIKLGRSVKQTEIGNLPYKEISTRVIEGPKEFVEEAKRDDLESVQQQLEEDPSKTVDTLLVTDKAIHSVGRLRKDIAKFGLRYVVFEKSGEFDGWISSSNFVAQLPSESDTVSYDELRNIVVGISKETVSPEDSVKKVLEKMMELHTDSIPVVDSGGKWLSFADRGEILGRLVTEIILQDVD